MRSHVRQVYERISSACSLDTGVIVYCSWDALYFIRFSYMVDVEFYRSVVRQGAEGLISMDSNLTLNCRQAMRYNTQVNRARARRTVERMGRGLQDL